MAGLNALLAEIKRRKWFALLFMLTLPLSAPLLGMLLLHVLWVIAQLWGLEAERLEPNPNLFVDVKTYMRLDELKGRERVAMVTGAVTFIAAIIAAAIAVWRSIIAQIQAKAALQQAEISAQTRISSDLAKAYELLANEQISIRIGAIYTLEKVMHEVHQSDPRLYFSIIESLTGFARAHSRELIKEATGPKTEDEINALKARKFEYINIYRIHIDERPANDDMHAVLTVIGRRPLIENEKPVDLTGLAAWNFSCVEPSLNLSGINLSKAHLERANLRRVHFAQANLKQAILVDADLKLADLRAAYLEHANLRRAYLEQADLSAAHLEKAELTDADLMHANLRSSSLEQTNLYCAHLEHANLRKADLSQSKKLVAKQIMLCFGDSNTKLPVGIKAPEHWSLDFDEQYEYIKKHSKS